MTIEEALSEYILSCEADGLSEATIKWYVSLLSAFSHSTAKDIADVTTKQLRQYIVELRTRDSRYIEEKQKPVQEGGLSEATIKGHITALHAFWAWCSREYAIANPMENIKRPKRRQPQPKSIAPGDFVKLFDATGDDIAGDRDRAILCFLADTGCRSAGLLGLKKEHLLLDQRKAIVHEKGNQSRMVAFTKYTARTLEKWLHSHCGVTPYVFYSFNTEDQLTNSGLNQMLKRLKKRSGVRGRVNPHSYRHGFARAYLQNGGDLVTLAKLLGHKDINTTGLYYAIFSQDELAELHDKFSPLRNFRGA